MLYANSAFYLSVRILFSAIVLTVLASGTATSSSGAQSGDEPYAGQPAWSPSGNRIAFVSNKDGNLDLWIMNADGTSEENITPGLSSFDLFPKWSPNENYIAFQSLQESEPAARSDIRIINMQTRSFLNLTRQLDDPVTLEDFAWSPNSQKIAFSVTMNGVSRNLRVIDVNGENLETITNEGVEVNHSVSWLSDSEIAFIADSQLKVHNLQDGSFMELADNVRSYEFSPDRHYLAWTTDINQSTVKADVWLMNLETLQKSRLAEINVIANSDLFWSPDNQYLLFISMCDQRATTLVVFDTNTDSATDITDCNLGSIAYPSWSPTGQFLVFQADKSGFMSLWQVRVDGFAPHEIGGSKH